MELGSSHIEEVIQVLMQRVDRLVAVYLFGSIVTDTFHESSDVDIAFLGDHGLSGNEVWDLGQNLTNVLNRNVGLVDLKNANTVMQMEVIGKGKSVYSCSEREQGSFEDHVFQMYLTLNDDRREIIQGVYDDGSVYG